MKKEDYLKQIEKESRNRTNILESIGGILKRGLDFGKKHFLPFVLALVLNMSAFSFVGCGEKQEIVNPGPGVTQGGGEDSGKNPETPETDDQGKDETGKDDPSNPGGSTEDPDKDNPNKPGESTDDPGKDEPGENEPGTEKPGTDDPNNPGGSTEEPTNPGETPEEPEEPDVQEPEQDISNLVVYVDEAGEPHVNMPVLQEATIEFMENNTILTPLGDKRILTLVAGYEVDEVLFSNYNSTDKELTIMWGGMDSDTSSTYGFTLLNLPLTLPVENGNISITDYNNILKTYTKFNQFPTQTFEPTIRSNDENMTEHEKAILNNLVTIASDNNRIDLNNLGLFFVTEVDSATPGQNLGICMGYRTYGIEKTDNQLVLRGFSIYSSMQFGVQSDELVQHEANIINYANGGADWIGVAGDNRTVLLTMEDFYVPSSEAVKTKTVNYVLPTKKEETEKTL